MESLIILRIIAAVSVGIASRQAAERRRKQQSLFEQQERRRVEACGEVVLFSANHLGYISRSLISRDESDGLIDRGIAPEALASEISRRIDDAGGLTLGYHRFGDFQIEVKLPREARDRHVYVVGKSWYGETNLLRGMIFQDLKDGSGIGVIAPEAEMLTEEILPCINVIYFNPADSQRPVSFNLLHLDEGEDLDLKVDETYTILSRLTGETSPRIGELLRQSLYALTEREEAPLADIGLLLLDPQDADLRSEIIRSSKETQIVHFWRDMYPNMPKGALLPMSDYFFPPRRAKPSTLPESSIQSLLKKHWSTCRSPKLP